MQRLGDGIVDYEFFLKLAHRPCLRLGPLALEQKMAPRSAAPFHRVEWDRSRPGYLVLGFSSRSFRKRSLAFLARS
jgi:hypothetical protein